MYIIFPACCNEKTLEVAFLEVSQFFSGSQEREPLDLSNQNIALQSLLQRRQTARTRTSQDPLRVIRSLKNAFSAN